MHLRRRSYLDVAYLPIEAMKSKGMVMVACNDQDEPIGHLVASVKGSEAIIDRTEVSSWASLHDALPATQESQLAAAGALLMEFVRANAGHPIKLGTTKVSPKVTSILGSLGFTLTTSGWVRHPTRKLTSKTAGAEPFAVFAADNKKGFVTDIEKDTTENTDFRRVLYTGAHLQLVLMSLKPNEDIGVETHSDVDQFFRVDDGSGVATIGGKDHKIKNGSAFIIPAGTEHNVTAGEEGLKIYSLYSPPNHADGTVHQTKGQAEKSREKFDGQTTE